jgi:hypothetical protein
MALGLNNNREGGDFLPIVKWDARSGRMFRVDRSQGINGWESNDVDITSPPPRMAVDFGSIETGWMHFSPTGPDFRMAALGTAMPERPSKEHKQGFRVKVAGQILGGVREFGTSAKSVLTAMDALHSSFESAPEAAAGKIPVVDITGSAPIVTNGPQGKVTSYAPVFVIVGWTDRMPEMGDRTVPPPRANGNGGHHAPPPPPVTPPPVYSAPPAAPAYQAPPAPPPVYTPSPASIPVGMPF